MATKPMPRKRPAKNNHSSPSRADKLDAEQVIELEKQKKRKRERKRSEEHIQKLFSEARLKENEQAELEAFVCEMVCKGDTVAEIREALENEWATFSRISKRQDPLRLMRNAARKSRMHYSPKTELVLEQTLHTEYDWPLAGLSVVRSRSMDHVAQRMAEKLLEMIRQFKIFGKKDTVRIGFAGGRMLRCVAEKLAAGLVIPSRDNPRRLIFHAMVAAFNEDDFEVDPNSFMNCLSDQPVSVEVGFVRIAAPGIIETATRHELPQKYREIREVYEDAKELDIIVSSGGDWADEHSTAQRYLMNVDESDVEKLNSYPAIGDLLWQPLAEDGPIDMDNGEFTYRPNTLVDLKDLGSRIKNSDLRVLLALGPCGLCGKPKGKLLNAIMNLEERLVTDIVTNSPAVYDALRIKWDIPDPGTKKAK